MKHGNVHLPLVSSCVFLTCGVQLT